MAEGTQRRRATPAQEEEARPDTRRVVLKRERVLVLPDGVTLADIDPKDAEAIRRLLGIKGGRANVQAHVEAWVVVGEFAGASKTKAIEAHAGKPGTPDAKPGAYKAPTWSAWSGGELYEKPPEPKVERRSLD
jgi:hypothetical protein